MLNLTTTIDPAVDESFADSTVSKRFTRKNISNEHTRNLRSNKPAEQSTPDHLPHSKEPQKTSKISSTLVKAEDLFLRITHTPTKSKHAYAPASSDRATESTYLRSRYETETASLLPSRECPLQLR